MEFKLIQNWVRASKTESFSLGEVSANVKFFFGLICWQSQRFSSNVQFKCEGQIVMSGHPLIEECCQNMTCPIALVLSTMYLPLSYIRCCLVLQKTQPSQKAGCHGKTCRWISHLDILVILTRRDLLPLMMRLDQVTFSWHFSRSLFSLSLHCIFLTSLSPNAEYSLQTSILWMWSQCTCWPGMESTLSAL